MLKEQQTGQEGILRHNNVENIFTTSKKINELLPLPKDQRPRSLQIKCATGHIHYTGRTTWRIHFRKEEHMVDVRKKSLTSSLYQHNQKKHAGFSGRELSPFPSYLHTVLDSIK